MQTQTSKAVVERINMNLTQEEWESIILAGLKELHGISLTGDIEIDTFASLDGMDIDIVCTSTIQETVNGIITV